MKVIQFTIPVDYDHSIHVQEDKLPYFYEHLHRHHETQITWIIKGEGTLIAGNVMQRFSPGDVFIIGANQPHLFKSDPDYFLELNEKKIHSLNIFFNPKGFITTLLDFPEMLSIKKFVESSAYGMQASAVNAMAVSEHISNVVSNTKGYRLSAFIQLLQHMADLKDW
ncbi:MAG TPA: cupin domain-containing protein, partial [Segetibacter sp.]